jgi:hypothetical protein
MCDVANTCFGSAIDPFARNSVSAIPVIRPHQVLGPSRLLTAIRSRRAHSSLAFIPVRRAALRTDTVLLCSREPSLVLVLRVCARPSGDENWFKNTISLLLLLLLLLRFIARRIVWSVSIFTISKPRTAVRRNPHSLTVRRKPRFLLGPVSFYKSVRPRPRIPSDRLSVVSGVFHRSLSHRDA